MILNIEITSKSSRRSDASADGGSDGLGGVPDPRPVLPGRCQQSEGFRSWPESLQHQLHHLRAEHLHSDLPPLPGGPHTQVTSHYRLRPDLPPGGALTCCCCVQRRGLGVLHRWRREVLGRGQLPRRQLVLAEQRHLQVRTSCRNGGDETYGGKRFS